MLAISTRTLFLNAGLANFAIVPVSLFFTNEAITREDPFFDAKGCALIVLWGVVYIATSGVAETSPLLCLAFTLEKAIYVIHYLRTASVHRRRALAGKATLRRTLAALFFATYGVADALFGVGFAVTGWRALMRGASV
ncbi:uncharacterized protein EV422DRAFT_569475 [Fimicolochytrium jonesii]|uniref:uncharacterized protein n=1 Tax=Fimicolochytrium jonesii TaxID=1396493 RepID=UPI0022FE1EDE|nr:uncharacterized protein EV422DRAFT_569475 [Fimicolochytrium jonesii]KAI8818819.1 hypothetical protein EV422DRAFT_569475 [Fimicolochytrium jonesii]